MILFGFRRKVAAPVAPDVVRSVSASETGLARTDNQDHVFVDDARLVYCVADGVGGGSDGAYASEIVCANLKMVTYAADETFKSRTSAVEKALEDANAVLFARARERGYAETVLGRRRTLRDINSRNATARQSAERDAINTPIQGSAADLVKLAMVKIDRALKAEGLRSKMVLQIHDELVFDCPKDEAARVKEIARREMTTALDFGVPLDVGLGEGANWLDAH